MSDDKKSKKGFYIILIIVLLLINGLLFYSTFQNKSKIQTLEEQKDLAFQQRQQLEIELNKTIAELTTYKTNNEQLNMLVDSLRKNLENKKLTISKLLSSKNFTTNRLEETEQLLKDTRLQIDALVADRDRYLNQLDSLESAFDALRIDYDTLSVQLDNQYEVSQKLKFERDSISNLGSILQSRNIICSGIKTKKSGKEVSENSIKKIDGLKICFDLGANRLVDSKDQTVLLKLTDPSGITLFEKTQGSGIFVNMENGEESKYSGKYNVDYKNDTEQQYCIYWKQDAEFKAGNYNVELYHKGFRIGDSEFELKKGGLF